VVMYGLLYDDERRARKTFDAVERTVPVKIVRKDGRLGERSLELRLMGTTPDWFDLVRRKLIAGRTLRERDGQRKAGAVVLTEHGARKLLATERTIGQSLRIGSTYYEVVGIVQSESGMSGSIQTPDQEIDAYVPIEVARERFGDYVTQVSTGSMSRESVELHQLIVQVDRTENRVCAFVEFGLFERSYLLLGMEAALMAYLTDTETMSDLLAAIADYKIRLVERFDDDTVVLPGHMGITQLGRERQTNPFLADLPAPTT